MKTVLSFTFLFWYLKPGTQELHQVELCPCCSLCPKTHLPLASDLQLLCFSLCPSRWSSLLFFLKFTMPGRDYFQIVSVSKPAALKLLLQFARLFHSCTLYSTWWFFKGKGVHTGICRAWLVEGYGYWGGWERPWEEFQAPVTACHQDQIHLVLSAFFV